MDTPSQRQDKYGCCYDWLASRIKITCRINLNKYEKIRRVDMTKENSDELHSNPYYVRVLIWLPHYLIGIIVLFSTLLFSLIIIKNY